MKISVSGIQKVQKMLERYKNIDQKALELAKKLCVVGEPIIRATHGGHASVAIEPIQNGYAIRADGKDVLFVEFGTGDASGSMAALYDQVPVSIYPGSWSEAHAKMYSTYGYWIFGGKKYTETPPHPAFYDAYRAMILALPAKASEVFKK